METNLEMTNIVPAPSGASRIEEDKLVAPIPNQPGVQKTLSDENKPRYYPPTILWTPIGFVKRIEGSDSENSDHTSITIPEPRVCRVCNFDDDDHDEDDILVELGCSCRGQMGRMHRNCILKWYGVRMILEKLYKCELCNTVLHPHAQMIVARGVSDHTNGGRAVLMAALKSSLASYAPHIDVEKAATYRELVQLLLDERADWYKLQPQLAMQIEAQAANPETRSDSLNSAGTSGRAAFLLVASVGIGMGIIMFLVHHFYGSTAFQD